MPDDPMPSRRSQRARDAIVQATLECCQEDGYDRVTIEGVARRAKVGKQTIYRWWPSKAAVLLESLNEKIGEAADHPNTGSVRDDLRVQMAVVVGLMTDPQLVAPYTGLLAAAQSDPEVAEAVLDQMIRPRRESCVRRLKQACADGQLRTDIDLENVVDMLYGTLYYRLLLRSAPISVDQINAVIDLAFEGLEPPAPT